jgi:hypothetical protein
LKNLAQARTIIAASGRNSAAECQLPKLDVIGSIPIARSNTSPAQAAEQQQLLGKW